MELEIDYDPPIPQPLLKTFESNEYTAGNCDLTVTDLLLPPRLFALKKKHGNEIQSLIRSTDSDILMRDGWAAFLGTLTHAILENNDEEAITEKRYFISRCGWTLGGKPDRVLKREGILEDWKTSRVDTFKYKVKDGFYDWVHQLNTYVELLHDNGIEISKIQVHVLFMDWSPIKAQNGQDYPKRPYLTVTIPVLPQKERLDFIDERIKLFQSALVEPPRCADVDRWMNGAGWAVMRLGSDRAVKILESEEEANEWVDKQKGSNYIVEERKGTAYRCQWYCPVARWCDQFQLEEQDKIESAKQAFKGL